MAIETIRIQAEDASVVRGNTGLGNTTPTTRPAVVMATTAAANDKIYAEAADGDAYVDFVGAPTSSGEYIEFKISVDTTGYYDLGIGYALAANELNRSMRLDVKNGAGSLNLFDRMFDLQSTGDFAKYAEQGTRVLLTSGENTIRLTSNGYSGPNIDYLEVRTADPTVFVFQGEDLVTKLTKQGNTGQALINRAISPASTPANEQFRTGAEGESYLDWAATSATAPAADKASVSAAVADFEFLAPSAGRYAVTLTYASGSARPLDLKLVSDDGQTRSLATFQVTATTPTTVNRPLPTDRADLLGVGDNHDNTAEINGGVITQFENWRPETVFVELAAGSNTLRLQLPPNAITGPNIDKVVVKLVDAAPADISVDDLSVSENAAGAVVGNVVVADADSASHTFEVSEDGTTSQRFDVIDGALRLKSGVLLDYEGQRSYPLTIEATDAGGRSVTKSFTVTVANDAGDDAPTGPSDQPATSLVLTAVPVAENAAGAVVATLAISDVDNTYAATDVALSGPNAVNFRVIGTPGALQLALVDDVALDFEAVSQPSVTVTAGGFTQEFTPAPGNVDEAPILAGSLADVALPSTGGSVSLAGLIKTDIDEDVTTFGARAATGTLPDGISVADGSLVVADGVAPGSYAVEVFATDGALNSNPVSFTLTVDAPVVEEPEEPFTQILIQAEAGVLTIVDADTNTNDTAIRNPWNKEASSVVGLVDGLRPGFSGSGYLDFGDTPGDKATYNFTVAEAGSYDIQIRYASNGARPLAFALDGATPGNLPFVSTGTSTAGPAEGFNNWSVQKVTVQLAAGTHSISLAIPSGTTSGPNLDAIAITATGATADFSAGNTAPVIPVSGFAVEEGTLAVGTVSASDLDGDRVDFALTTSTATDNALFTVAPRTGALTFKAAPDFEAPADADSDNAYRVEVEAFDGTARVTKILTVTVTNDTSDDVLNRAPVVTTTELVADENQIAAGSVAATDDDADALSYSLTVNAETNNALFTIDAATGALSFLAAPDYEALESDNIFTVEVAVSDGVATTTKSITVTVADVAEGGPVSIALKTLTPYSSQDRPQDGGAGGALTDGGQALFLDGNLWKRAAIDNAYAITATTKLVFDVALGTGGKAPEIAAIGFDFDEDPFDTDKSIYQVGGTQTQQGFIDLRGKGTVNEDGTARFEIDLGSHAGKTLSSLVFVNDDDTKASLGSSSYSNLQFVEKTVVVENRAPVAVGGGIADRTVPENGSIEIDLPFADADGDSLTYSFAIKDSAGDAVANPVGLSIVDGVLTGSVAGLGDGVFTVTVTASDGQASASDAFDLTVENVNEAPVAEDVALEPYSGSVGSAFEGFDVNGFASYFSDPDGDALTLSVEGLPNGLSLNEEGYVSGSPREAGTFEITIRATDAFGLSDTITLTLVVDGPQVGDVVSIEAEAFTQLSEATGFLATGSATASGDRLILLNQNAQGAVSTELAESGLVPGYYTVTVYAFDETDGASTFSLTVGDTKLTASGSSSVTLNDAGAGTFVNPTAPRGTTSQAGNLKAIAFDTVVYVGADTVATLSGLAQGAESLRIDRVAFTRVEAPNTAPSSVMLTGSVDENAAGAVVGILSATDAEGDAVTFTTSDPRFVIAKNAVTGAVELKLATGVALNHESDDGTQVSVVATDAVGNAASANLSLSVNDVNEAPVLSGTIASQSFEAGEGGEINLLALGAVDPDAGDTVSYVAKLADGTALPAGLILDGSVLKVADTAAAGSYAVVVFATDGEKDSESVSFTVTVSEPGTEEPQPFSLLVQAEAGTLTILDTDANTTDTAIRDAGNPELGNNPSLINGLRPGFTGTGYLDYGDTAGDKATYTIEVPAAGAYDIKVRYATNSARPLDLVVNGGTPETMAFAATGTNVQGPAEGFNNWAFETVRVELQAGANTLSFAIPSGATTGPNLDSFEVIRVIEAADTSADADGNLFLSGPQGELTGAARESINFSIAGRDLDIVKTEISFDNGVTRVAVNPDADGDFVANGSALTPGSYTAIVYVTDDAGNVASSSMNVVIGNDGPVTVLPFTIQAEDATKVTVQDTGVPTNADFTRVVTSANPDATGNYRAGGVGGAYMDFGANAGDAITINVEAPAAGTYLVTFRYANGGAANRPLDLSLNGGAAQSVDFVPGPVVGTGTTANGWESWEQKTVELTLSAGANTIKLAIPAGATSGPNVDEIRFTFKDDAGPVEPQPFLLTIEAETFTPIDTTGTAAELTQARTASNPETRVLPRDIDGNGLWDGATGTGYMDMGAQIGDAASFTVNAPSAGTYTFSFRYSNGGGAPNGDRPMSLSVGGETVTVAFPGTGVDGWDNWQTATVDVALSAGVNTVRIANTVANGPNLDRVTVSRDDAGPVDPRGQITFEEVVKINFQPAAGQTTQGLPAGYVTPAGYLADTGGAFGDRSNGFSYGWVTEASVADGTANGTIAAAQPANAHWYKNTVPGASDLQKTYAHFEYPGAGAAGARAWEMAVANGTYQVQISVGDTAGAFDSNYNINVEGQSFMPDWVPANPINGSPNGGGFRSTLVTGVVTVTDGRLTIDSIGGENTEVQYLELERITDLTPTDGRTADLDYSFFAAPRAAYLNDQVSIEIGENGNLPTGINPLSSLVVGVNVANNGNRGPNIAYVDGIKLVETLTGQEVAINVQISGGADSLTIRPLQQLKDNTSYTLKVEDVLDLGSITDATAPLRQMQDLTTTFVTGVASVEVAREVAFTTQTLLNGFVDGAGGFTSIEFGPDGKLYAATIIGEIFRWSVNSDGTIDKTSKESLILDYLQSGEDRRGIIGFTFDPGDPNTIWISDNYPIPRENKAFDTPEFSGRVSKILLGEGGSFQGATAEAYLTGLPRSGGDHVTNSLEFRPNPNAAQNGEPDYLLYLSQGSNSAAGAPDGAWGNRPERLLNAAVLEIDPTRDAPTGGFNVRTEPVTTPTTQNLASAFNQDGTYPGFYNPYAEDAVLKIFATGIRNAYDLVWHSNGNLYMPTNGTASGGKTFDDPTQSGTQVIVNSPTQDDYFFTVEQGKYYGHTNILRDEYILNGGNPTLGVDKNEVTDRKDGNPNTDGYDVGVRPDPNYDIDGAYSLGRNQSPNGAIEYKGSAFGSNLKGAILFAQFSTGDNVRSILVDANGTIIGDDVLRRPDGSVINNYIDPLDIIENPVTGQLYLMTLNRGTGASQLILLTPAPGGVTQDLTADEGNNLALVALDVSNPSAAVFQINGLDDDITAVRISFNGGPFQTVAPNAQDRFTVDLGTLTGNVTARIEVTDTALNRAQTTASFVPGQAPNPGTGDLVSLVTIQAEDTTPGDGTSVSIATGTTAQIAIRTGNAPEPNATGTGYVNGLRPGAVGLDGNTVNTDGVPGGYADFGSTNVDFVTFTFTVPADQAGAGLIRVRFANGGTADRPLEVFVNGASIGIKPFLPPSGVTGDAAWSTWQTSEIPASLVGGLNTVTFRATAATGPNIDQIEVLVPEATAPTVPYTYYEAESAQLVGAVIATDPRNQEGTGYVDFTTGGDQTITWTVSSASAGSFEIAFRYALAATKADRPLTLTVNGVDLGPLNFDGFSNAAETEWQFQTATVNLVSGTNTIRLTAPNAVGPNIDQLRVANGLAAPPFEPDYVTVTTETRIELEQTADNSTRILNNQAVDFFFKVSADGLYALDLAANAGAPNGTGLRLFLNGVAVEELAFPGVGTVGEQTAYLQLTQGTDYQLRVFSNAPGASAIDYLDVRRAPGNANADIAVQSLDPAFLDNRLHFSFLENPDGVAPDDPDRDFKDTGTVRISNTGTEALTLTDYELTGPFVLANPAQLEGLTIAAGAFVDVTVNFNRAAYTPPTANIDATSTIFTGALRLITNDADTPIVTVDLAGFWQAQDEGGQEPNVNEVWKIFGFGNVIEGLSLRGGGENSTLSTDDVFAKTDETEVLSPYWRIADGVTNAKITQIAAFHGTGGATLHIHNPGNKGSNVQFWNHEGTDNQRLLPNAGNDTAFATRTFDRGVIPDNWAGNDIFGISVAGLSTDPRLNPTGNVIVPGAQQGHTVKVFQALDGSGVAIPNTFLVVMDYTGINYDYNDNLFVVEGVTPVGFGQRMVVAGLDDAAADERLVFTNIDTPANGTQAFRNEAMITLSNDGSAPLSIQSVATGSPSFEIVGAVPTSIAAGASAQIMVRFTGAHTGTAAGADLYRSTLTIVSNDFAQGQKVIQLAGLAQEFSENNSEPTVAQIVEAFGYSTNVEQGELAGGGVVETIGDEVLMPYLERLDATKAVEVIQIAAFLNQGNVARLGVHGLGSSQVTNLFANDDQQGQTVLPDQLVAGAGAGANVARGTISGTTPFGLYISVDGRPTYSSWTDPEANKIDPNFGQLVGENQGHLIRFFQAEDGAGNPIAGTFIGIQDYPGAGNYDYNDHMFVIKNVKPHALTSANDANGDGINDALQLDTDNDGAVNFFDTTTTPPPGPQQAFGGTAPVIAASLVTIDATRFDTGGQGVAYNDTTATDLGGTTGRNEGVDIVGNNVAVGWIEPGEWVEYTINVERAGLHSLRFAAASPDPSRTITASFEQNGVTYRTAPAANVVDTNNYTSFTPTAPIQVDLAAGVQTVRLSFAGGAFDLDSFTLDRLNIAPTVAQTLPAQSATQGQVFSYTLPTGLFTDVDGDALSLSVSGLPTGLSFNATTRVISGTPAAAAQLTLQVTASDGAASVSTPLALTVAPGTATPQAPFGGTAPSFANGRLVVDASNFDTGGQGVAYNDNSGKDGGTSFRPGDAVEFVNTQNDIGYVRPGEWIEYTINVPASGVYDLSLLAKTPLANASVAVSLGGGAPLATVSLQDGGTSFDNAPFQATLPVALTLPTGQQTIRLTFNGTPQAGSEYLADLREFSLTAVPPANAQTPFGGTAPGFVNGALTRDASNYDEGGQGVAYNDTPGLQGGTTGGRTGSAVEQTAAGDIGWIDPGEWLEYTINVGTAGAHDLSLLLSNGGGTGRSATVAFFKPGAATPYVTTGPIANPSTGGFNTFQPRTADDVVLETGVQVVRVTFAGGSQDFRSFSLTAPSNPQAPYPGATTTFTNGVLTVDASNFDTGGQGVAYNDNPGKDGGTSFRPGDAVEFVNAQNDLGYILPGEWVEYTVNVPASGVYDLSLLAKTPLANATVAVSLGGGAPLATVNLQDGGTSFGGAPFQATLPVALTLPTGQQTIRLTFNGTPQAGSDYVADLRSFTLDLREPPALAAGQQQSTGQGTNPDFSETPTAITSPITVFTPQNPAGEIFALYDAAFSRVPDYVGEQFFTEARSNGWSLNQLADSMLTSPEGKSHFGMIDNTTFVQELYRTALHREGEPAGISHWVSALDQGLSRAEILVCFALSPENLQGFDGNLLLALEHGSHASAVGRLYHGLLDRAPDATGLTHFTQAMEAGTPLEDIVQVMLDSPEYGDRFPDLSDGAFVDALYDGALGRQAEAEGWQAWTDALGHGASRQSVAVDITQSPEARMHLAEMSETVVCMLTEAGELNPLTKSIEIA